MPAKSKAQQRLMGQAYAVKKGELSLDDVDQNYRDEIERLANEMSLEDLKDFAETSHEGLPDKVEEFLKKIPHLRSIFEDMGAIELPTASATVDGESGELGSGDALYAMSWDEYINSEEDEDEGDNEDENSNKDENLNSKMKYLTKQRYTAEKFTQKIC